ncbi:hypothetical protein GIB67_012166 [Kingdonia uniflora]|uniref:DNA2/NAM7 helicase-like C-terminal domain-containing protein n=1 Tax=Kingdonia uniflora TaxID=39325 RepID=A0A7J7NPB6_9MAGN|nr:hypothetical protein GIB67_012166 [Kingdonia uniflora]
MRIKISVGIISPYNAQVSTLITKFGSKYKNCSDFSLRIRSVDGFQGSEEDVIIISTVTFGDGFKKSLERIKVHIQRKVVDLMMKLSNGWHYPQKRKNLNTGDGAASSLVSSVTNVSGLQSLEQNDSIVQTISHILHSYAYKLFTDATGGINGAQFYTIDHFGEDIVHPKIRLIVSYVGGSTKLTSLRAHSSYENFVILLEETSKICLEDSEFQSEPHPEQVKDLLDFQFKSAAYTEDPYDFNKEFNIGDLYRDKIDAVSRKILLFYFPILPYSFTCIHTLCIHITLHPHHILASVPCSLLSMVLLVLRFCGRLPGGGCVEEVVHCGLFSSVALGLLPFSKADGYPGCVGHEVAIVLGLLPFSEADGYPGCVGHEVAVVLGLLPFSEADGYPGLTAVLFEP